MKFAHSLNELYEQVKLRKLPFLVVFFIAVLISYGILYAIDFIPETPKEQSKPADTSSQATQITPAQSKTPAAPIVPAKTLSPYPVKIIFDSLSGKEVKISNPTSRVVADLDNALLSGAVRHPDSADLVHTGNIFILGHSSYLPVVYNKNFQAFNGIQNLVWGDTIRVQSTDTEYVYRVQKVYKAKTSDVVVPQTPGKAELTLATCNSFGTKDDRFIVEASLVSSHALSS